MEKMLLEFYKSTRLKPERIIYVRDGVSEGQFAAIKRAELAQIFACMAKIGRAAGEEYAPPVLHSLSDLLSFFVVQ